MAVATDLNKIGALQRPNHARGRGLRHADRVGVVPHFGAMVAGDLLRYSDITRLKPQMSA